ncbi:MAG: hypothetical protein GY696_30655, partial [Gammaproteobacteria bacterium]|nr:hypothetical protein [Gammaproteobacteria bacterium]
MKEMQNYRVEILGLSETRWLGSGEEKLRNGIKVLYSGHSNLNDKHTQGVALMLSRTAQKSLKSWEPHGPRIVEAFFKTPKKEISLRVVSCYAPTNDADEAIKDVFYNKLD